MYANGKRIRFEPFSDATAVTKAFGKYYVNDADVSTCVEYSNPETLTMTFEGGFHRVINECYAYTYCQKLEQKFRDILHKYGLYYEQGYEWSLACYFE